MARTIVPSAARTTDGDSGAVTLAARSADSAALLVDVTAVGGTSPTLDLEIEWSHDAVAWAAPETPDVFTQITGVGTVVARFDVKGPYYRVTWAIGGTSPSVTFSVSEHVTT